MLIYVTVGIIRSYRICFIGSAIKELLNSCSILFKAFFTLFFRKILVHTNFHFKI